MRSFFRTFSVILLILWMGFIFYMSAQPAEISSQISGGFIEVIAEKVYPEFESLSKAEQSEIIASFQFVVRKSAHIGAFALLGFLSFLSFISYNRLRFFTRAFFSVIISVLYAASDELHQRFVSGRSCELRDFLLDCFGVLGAVIISSLFVKIIPPLRRKTAYIKKQRIEASFESFTDEIAEPTVFDKATGEVLESEDSYKAELQNLVEQQKKKIEDLTVSLAEKTAEITKIKADNKENEMGASKDLSDEMKYAASVIGKAVVEVTKVCNKLLTDENNDNAKELVNLALGRNEVFKANVLKILGEKLELSEKQALIEKERCEAFDYFDSILAQNC